MKILINAGHAPNGRPDPGAVGPTGLRECDVTATVAHYVCDYLTSVGITADFVQDDDLNRIVAMCRDGDYDLFLSIHCNSFNEYAHGIEVYTSPGFTFADRFAEYLLDEMHETFPKLVLRVDPSDGDNDKEAAFFVLIATPCPAALFELPFISNPIEEAWLKDDNNLVDAARAMARAVTSYEVEAVRRGWV